MNDDTTALLGFLFWVLVAIDLAIIVWWLGRRVLSRLDTKITNAFDEWERG